MSFRKLWTISLFSVLIWMGTSLLSSASVNAQGSIFGTVQNSDLNTPPDGAILFFGFLDDTDEEIRIESSTGAGYDAGNWFDDFQNYLTEAAGNPYDYYFYNASRGEGFHLAKLIPDNSFQQENVVLQPVVWPQKPTGFTATVESPDIVLRWTSVSGQSVHIYRRPASSDGSFFRIDNTAGELFDFGVADSVYVDATVDAGVAYDYVLIADDGAGNYSPHSVVVTADPNAASCCVSPAGDLNDDGTDANAVDLAYLVDYLFNGGPFAVCAEEGDINGDGTSSTAVDLAYLVDLIFRGGPGPADCL